MPSHEIVGENVRPDFLGRTRLDEQVAEILAFAFLGRFFVKLFVET
jgi:hypothetical protein